MFLADVVPFGRVILQVVELEALVLGHAEVIQLDEASGIGVAGRSACLDFDASLPVIPYLVLNRTPVFARW